MNKQVKSIFDFFKKEEEVKITFSEVQTVDGITLFYEGDLAVGTPVFVLDAENNQIPAPEGDFQVEYEDNVWVVSVDVNGVITALEEVMSEETPEETPSPEMMSKEEFSSMTEKIINDIDERFKALEDKFNELANVKESKFKDERKKVEEFKSLTVKEILTKK
jgi:hypothetical protein